MALSSQELVRRLRDEGVKNADAQRIRYGILQGFIDRPDMFAGSFVFTPKHVDQVRKYLRKVPAPGRKSAETVKN